MSETITKLQELNDRATPAPWCEFCESGDWWIEGADSDGSPSGGTVCISDTDKTWTAQEDIDLTVVARNALLPLLRVARAAEMLEALKSEVGSALDQPVANFNRRKSSAWHELRAALRELEELRP